MAELNEIEQVVRTGCAACGTRWACRSTSSPAHQPQTLHHQPDRDRQADDQLDVLLPLAGALQVDLDALLDMRSDDDVVIRPVPSSSGGRTTWMLSRPTGNTVAVKIRLEPSDRPPEPRVHPGHDWFFVIEGRVRLLLGEREIIVEAGEAAEFATMTPHSFAASTARRSSS